MHSVTILVWILILSYSCSESLQAPAVFSQSTGKTLLSEDRFPTATEGQDVIVQTRVPKFPGKYGRQAMLNLSTWRSGLFQRAIKATDLLKEQKFDLAVRVQPVQRVSKLNVFNTFVECPEDMPLTRHQTKTEQMDAGKWFCSVKALQPPCVVYSAGSKGDYDFEQYILDNTPCTVHTFDCTYDGRSQGERHHYHKLCLGKLPGSFRKVPEFKELGEVMSMLGHKQLDMLKIDIEGFEFDVMQDWNELMPHLPDQLVLEVHYDLPQGALGGARTVHTVPAMALFMGHLANLGYGIIGMEENLNGDCCAEMGLLRVEVPIHLRLAPNGMLEPMGERELQESMQAGRDGGPGTRENGKQNQQQQGKGPVGSSTLGQTQTMQNVILQGNRGQQSERWGSKSYDPDGDWKNPYGTGQGKQDRHGTGLGANMDTKSGSGANLGSNSGGGLGSNPGNNDVIIRGGNSNRKQHPLLLLSNMPSPPAPRVTTAKDLFFRAAESQHNQGSRDSGSSNSASSNSASSNSASSNSALSNSASSALNSRGGKNLGQHADGGVVHSKIGQTRGSVGQTGQTRGSVGQTGQTQPRGTQPVQNRLVGKLEGEEEGVAFDPWDQQVDQEGNQTMSQQVGQTMSQQGGQTMSQQGGQMMSQQASQQAGQTTGQQHSQVKHNQQSGQTSSQLPVKRSSQQEWDFELAKEFDVVPDKRPIPSGDILDYEDSRGAAGW